MITKIAIAFGIVVVVVGLGLVVFAVVDAVIYFATAPWTAAAKARRREGR